MKHTSGDILRPRDCVLLRSGPRKADLPFVAKIAALWENPDDGTKIFLYQNEKKKNRNKKII